MTTENLFLLIDPPVLTQADVPLRPPLRLIVQYLPPHVHDLGVHYFGFGTWIIRGIYPNGSYCYLMQHRDQAYLESLLPGLIHYQETR